MIKTAIIPVAGYGTRRLPITKAIEKCMLPIGNRPLVDYVVADCLAAGVTEIYFVISPDSKQLRDYYTRNLPLEEYLRKHGKTAELELVAPAAGANFHYVVQNPNDKYGTAVPVALAYQQALADGLDPEAGVAVLMGDDFIYRPEGESTVGELIEAYGDASESGSGSGSDSGSGETSVLLGVRIERDNPNKYGFLDMDAAGNLRKITESLTAAESPSDLINVSKYIMSPSLLRAVAEYVAAPTADPEYYLTTAPFDNYLTAGHRIRVLPANGKYLDGGSLAGWLEANRVVAGV